MRTGSACPSCTSCAAGSAGAGSPGCACWSPTRRRAARRGTGWTRSPPPWTGSRCPGSASSSRREGNVLGAVQAGRKSGLKMLTLLQDEELIVQARVEAQALVDGDPQLASHPALAGAIRTLLDEEQAQFLEKA